MFELRLDPDEKLLLPYTGHQVCLIMKDGSRKIGQLTACASGRLTLNGGSAYPDEAIISRKTSTRRTGRRRARKPQESPEPQRLRPQQDGEWGDFMLAPLGEEPAFQSMPKETVPLKRVESILVL